MRRKRKRLLWICFAILFLCIVGVDCLYFFTNVFNNHILPIQIKSISLQYIPTYSLAYEDTDDSDDNVYIDLQSVSIKGNNLQNIKQDLKSVKKGLLESKDYPIARLIINDDTTLLIYDDEIGTFIQNKKKTPVTYSNKLYQDVLSLIEKNNENILTKISFESIILHTDGASVSVLNEKNLKLIHQYLAYYEVHRNDEVYADDDSVIQLTLDSKNNIYLHSDHSAYCQLEGKNSFYATFPDELLQVIQKIIDVSVEK